MVIWPRIMILLATLPILFFIPWPTDPRFYMAVVATGMIVGFADTQTMNVTRTHGGGVVSRIMPFQIFIIFVVWLALRPEQIAEYMNAPLRSLGVIAALTGCVYFSSHMRQCELSGDAFRKLLIPLVGYALVFVLAKYAFEHSSFHSGVYYYILIQTLAVLPIMLISARFAKKDFLKVERQILFSKTTLKVAVFIFIFWFLHMIGKNYANTLTPNPSYVAALVLTSPIWMMLINKATGHPDSGNIKAGVGLMISAIVLVLLKA